MKYKIISAVGITAAILLFVFDSAMALYDLGTGESVVDAHWKIFDFL
ncbi:MAG: hypothetical protein IJV84_03230 [Bacteroidales bacterium]|nr:hypothetical protein [Bacteroidales bacterium]